MCGRYTLLNEQDTLEITKILQEVEQQLGRELNTKEIYPTNVAPVLTGPDLQPKPFVWGFPPFRNKGSVLINARAETALEKKTFHEAVLHRRCIIPSTGFFEWKRDSTKQKYLFTLPGEPVLYMAGLYSIYDGQERFVILTTSPNESVADIHNRMPLVLPKSKLSEWMKDTNTAIPLLSKTPPPLQKHAV